MCSVMTCFLTKLLASYTMISPIVALPGYARYELEWLIERAQRPARGEEGERAIIGFNLNSEM